MARHDPRLPGLQDALSPLRDRDLPLIEDACDEHDLDRRVYLPKILETAGNAT